MGRDRQAGPGAPWSSRGFQAPAPHPRHCFPTNRIPTRIPGAHISIEAEWAHLKLMVWRVVPSLYSCTPKSCFLESSQRKKSKLQ